MKVYLLEINLDFGIDYDDISNKVICVSKNKEVLEEAYTDFLKKRHKIFSKINTEVNKLQNNVWAKSAKKIIEEESWHFYQEDNPLDFLLIKSVWQEGYSEFNILEIEEI